MCGFAASRCAGTSFAVRGLRPGVRCPAGALSALRAAGRALNCHAAAGRCGAVRSRRNAGGHGARSRRRAQPRSPRPRAQPGRPRRAAFLVVARGAGPASRRDGRRPRASRLWRAARRVSGALRGGALRRYETVRGCGHVARRHRSTLAQVGNRDQQGGAVHDAAHRNGWGSASAPWRWSAATRHLFPSRTRRRCWRRRASLA